jgi:hypothetical protein
MKELRRLRSEQRPVNSERLEILSGSILHFS